MPKTNKCFSLRFAVTALGGKKGEVKIYSIIDTMKFWPDDPAVTADDFDKQLAALGDIDELTVRINSPGGVLTEAVAIRAMLMKHPAKKTIDIEGDCASAATVIACLPGAHVRMAKGSQYMIHQAKCGARGTAENMLNAANMLQKCDRDMAEIYAERTGKTADECIELMKKETWFTAEEAVENKFADEVLTGEDAMEPIVACAVDEETMELMRACYDHAPEHLIRQNAPSNQGEDQPISTGAEAAAAPSEHTENKEENPMDLKTVTAEQLNQENPDLAQAIAQQAVAAERERVQQIEALTPPYAEYEQMRDKAVQDGTSAEAYFKQIVAAQKKKGADYLKNRIDETAASSAVKGGSADDNQTDPEAKKEQFAKDVAAMASQSDQTEVRAMAQ